MKKIMVLGSFVVDLTGYTQHVPVPGETVLGDLFKMGPGGKGSNQAIAAAEAGADVAFVTKLGKDTFSKIACDAFSEHGIRQDFILFDDEKATGTALILVDKDSGQNSIVVIPSACLNITEEDVENVEICIQNSDIFLTQLETNIQAVYRSVDIAYREGIPVILNPAPYQEIDMELLKKVFCVTPNETEAASMTGIDTSTMEGVKKAAAFLYEKGAQNVVITLGRNGVYLKQKETEEHIHAFAVDHVIDTTGAGDAFNGAFACAVAEGLDLRNACVFGNAAASISVQRMGTARSMPARNEIEQRLKEFGVEII